MGKGNQKSIKFKSNFQPQTILRFNWIDTIEKFPSFKLIQINLEQITLHAEKTKNYYYNMNIKLSLNIQLASNNNLLYNFYFISLLKKKTKKKFFFHTQ